MTAALRLPGAVSGEAAVLPFPARLQGLSTITRATDEELYYGRGGRGGAGAARLADAGGWPVCL